MADSYSLKAILSAVDGISPVLKNVATFSKSARKYLGDVGSSLNALTSKLGIPLGVVTAIGAGFGFTAIKKAIVDFADLGEAAQKGALKAGMSTDDWQRYKYVFDQAGVSVETMEGSLGKLNKNLANAGSGKNKDLEALLKTLGIPLRGVNGQVRNATELLPQLADAFVKNRDPVKQAAIGNALFGKSFAEMLPLLNEGSAGIYRSMARIKSLKGIISQDDLKGAKDFGDQLKDLNIVTKGFQMTIAKELVPVLSPLIEDFIQWAAVNKKLIAGEVKQMVQGLVGALKQIDWAAFIQGVKGAMSNVGGLVDKLGGLQNALIALFVLMNVQSIVAIGALVASFGRLTMALGGVIARMAVLGGSAALGAIRGIQGIALAMRIMGLSAAVSWALALGPILLIGAVLAAVAYLIYANWGGIKAFFDGVWDGFTSALSPVAAAFGPVMDAVKSLIGWIGSLFGSTSKGKDDFAAWAAAGRIAGDLVAGVFKAMLAPIFAVVDAISLVVAAFKFLGGGGFKFDSSLGKLWGGVGPAGGESAAAIAGSPSPAAPGALGSGTFNMNAPATASLNGKVEVDFKNAPPGMMVTQAKADGGRVAMNTNVGYRSLSFDSPI